MLGISLVSVAVDLIAIEYCPVFFESVRVSLQVAYAFEENILLLGGAAETLNDLIILLHRCCREVG